MTKAAAPPSDLGLGRKVKVFQGPSDWDLVSDRMLVTLYGFPHPRSPGVHEPVLHSLPKRLYLFKSSLQKPRRLPEHTRQSGLQTACFLAPGNETEKSTRVDYRSNLDLRQQREGGVNGLYPFLGSSQERFLS